LTSTRSPPTSRASDAKVSIEVITRNLAVAGGAHASNARAASHLMRSSLEWVRAVRAHRQLDLQERHLAVRRPPGPDLLQEPAEARKPAGLEGDRARCAVAARDASALGQAEQIEPPAQEPASRDLHHRLGVERAAGRAALPGAGEVFGRP